MVIWQDRAPKNLASPIFDFATLSTLITTHHNGPKIGNTIGWFPNPPPMELFILAMLEHHKSPGWCVNVALFLTAPPAEISHAYSEKISFSRQQRRQWTIAARGLEELLFQLCCCVSFLFWGEISFGFTYLRTLLNKLFYKLIFF